MGQEVSTLSVREFCAAENLASNQCLELVSYDRDKCGQQFQDYRDCKKRWKAYRDSVALAIRKGETPPDPPSHVIEHLISNPSKDARSSSKIRRNLHNESQQSSPNSV